MQVLLPRFITNILNLKINKTLSAQLQAIFEQTLYLQLAVEAGMNLRIELEQAWMSITGPKTTCRVIHPGTTCLSEITGKSLEVVGKSSKLYALLYLAMFLLKFKKIRSQGKLKKTIIAWAKDYLWSLVFMSWIVGGMKLALCTLNCLGSPLDGRITPLLSLMGSPSIYFIQKQRRQEVVFFTFVRACRSAYIFLKKRYNFRVSCEKQLSFVMLYGALAYIYLEKPVDLRNKQFLVSLWGEV